MNATTMTFETVCSIEKAVEKYGFAAVLRQLVSLAQSAADGAHGSSADVAEAYQEIDGALGEALARVERAEVSGAL